MNSPEHRSPAEPAPLSFGQRFLFVWAWFFRGLVDGALAAQLRNAQLEYDQLQGRAQLPGATERPSLPPQPPTAAEVAPTAEREALLATARRGAALGLLSLLQREGRLVDFVQQDVSAFSDADIGAAARLVHAGCRKALAEHVSIQPVATQAEGSPIRLEAGYEPAAYKLTGQVSGSAPYTGVLRHKGWRATSLSLPESVAGVDNSVLMPAEVEV